MGFPDSSVSKESTCSAGDPSLIPGSGRSPGEGIGYQLQYSWASLVAQLVTNLPAMWETWVWFLGWKDPQPIELNGHPLQYTFLENSIYRGPWQTIVHRFTKSQTRLSGFTLVIREMQIKTTMKYYLTPVRMAIIKKTHKQQMLDRVCRKGNPPTLLMGM